MQMSCCAVLSARNVQLEIGTEAGLAPALVNPTQVEQVVLNLAINARDAMPDGGIQTVETRTVEGTDLPPASLIPGTYLCLRIRDTGVGMSPDVTPHIFEPFFTTKGTGEGAGLGLSTVMGIVDGAGGDIDVQSELNVVPRLTSIFPRWCHRLLCRAGCLQPTTVCHRLLNGALWRNKRALAGWTGTVRKMNNTEQKTRGGSRKNVLDALGTKLTMNCPRLYNYFLR